MKRVKFSVRATACLFMFFAVPACAKMITGIPDIVDGDTVDVGKMPIRLLGMDAPESDQICLDGKMASSNCGIAARDTLKAKSGGDHGHRLRRNPISGDLGAGRVLSMVRTLINGWSVKAGRCLQ